jgi:ADP-dependent phosphofructokinase/glucokinase
MASSVVLGIGGGVDCELALSAPIVEQLVDVYRVRTAELSAPAIVRSERDLVISILTYVRNGGGGEHFVASAEALRTFARRFPHRLTLGGTSVRAAIAMSRLGVPATLHLVTINDVVRRLLPADCDYICSGTEDTLYPHLIVQYDRDLRVRAGDIDLRAPSANRLIYVNDPANEALRLSDELGALLRGARIFLISGLNAVRDQGVLDQRLSELRCHMDELPPEAVVVYEDAGFHEPALSQRVRDALLGVIDMYGLNEDEMQAHLGSAVDLLSPTDVARALTSLRTLIPAPTLVVHTRYWAAAIGDAADEYATALNGGMVIAGTRYAHGDDYTDRQYHLMRRRPRRSEAVTFAAALERRMGGLVRCVPGFHLDVAEPTTIGLGDTFVGGVLAAVSEQKAARWT